MEALISDEYKALLSKKHADKPWGGAGKSWAPIVAPLLNVFNEGFTILDYGCGRGTFKPAMEVLRPDAIITEYDPGVAGKDILSWAPVDYIVCTDVLEHVEEQYVEKTLQTLNFLAVHGIFLNIDTALSKSFLPDGRNTHITVKPAEWWLERLVKHFPAMKWTTLEHSKGRIVVHGLRDWSPLIEMEAEDE